MTPAALSLADPAPAAQVNHAAAAAIAADARARDEIAARIWAEKRTAGDYPELSALAAGFAAGAQEFDRAAARWKNPLAWPVTPAPAPGRLVKTDAGWTRRPLDDARQSDPTPYPHAAAVVRQTKADRDYLSRAKTTTGDAPGPQHARQKRDRAILLSQSHELAQRLEKAGCPAYRKDGAGLWVWWVCSKQAEQLPQFRRICFLPTVAASVRASKLAALEFFIDSTRLPNGANACRFWTFTAGKRVRVEQLRERIEWLHAKLNKLNQFLRRQWGIELVFRSTELGTLETGAPGAGPAQMEFGPRDFSDSGEIEKDTDGAPLFHPHAHCVLYQSRGFMPNWSDVIDSVWAFWKDDAGDQLIWNAGKKGQPGYVKNARELCKYVTKPGDMLKLTPAHLAATEAALHGLHLVCPLGALKKQIAARRNAGKILVRVPADGGTVWAEKDDWNKWLQEDEADKAARANLEDAALMTKETAAAARVDPPAAPRDVNQPKAWTRIFARLDPAVGPSGVKEARVVVGGSVFHRPTVENHPLVARLWRQTVQDFECGLAAERRAVMGAPWRSDRINVHTGTPTATDPAPAPDSWPPDEWETALPVEIAAYFAP
jgi:hypothetical protein